MTDETIVFDDGDPEGFNYDEDEEEATGEVEASELSEDERLIAQFTEAEQVAAEERVAADALFRVQSAEAERLSPDWVEPHVDTPIETFAASIAASNIADMRARLQAANDALARPPVDAVDAEESEAPVIDFESMSSAEFRRFIGQTPYERGR